jgi:hypothetical protein
VTDRVNMKREGRAFPSFGLVFMAPLNCLADSKRRVYIGLLQRPSLLQSPHHISVPSLVFNFLVRNSLSLWPDW